MIRDGPSAFDIKTLYVGLSQFFKLIAFTASYGPSEVLARFSLKLVFCVRVVCNRTYTWFAPRSVDFGLFFMRASLA